MLKLCCSPRGLFFSSAITLFAMLAFAGVAHAAPIYVESGGQVVPEAEGFSSRSAAVDLPEGLGGDTFPDQWWIIASEQSSYGSFSGERGEFLQVFDSNGPNGEGDFTAPYTGPFVDYVVRIETLGDYELFARWDSLGSQNNSFWAMLLDPGGSPVGSTFQFGFLDEHTDRSFATDPWDDENAIFTIASAGDYTIRLAAREDGVAVDTLVFQRTSLAAPTGNGPEATIPIPQPSTLLLTSLGLLGLARLGRRRGGP